MKKYRVLMVEHHYGYVDIEANSKKEAEEKATIEHVSGNVTWNMVNVLPAYTYEMTPEQAAQKDTGHTTRYL